MSHDDLAPFEAEIHRARAALAALRELAAQPERSAALPTDYAPHVRNLHQALVRLAVSASVLHEEYLRYLELAAPAVPELLPVQPPTGPTTVQEAGRKGGRTVKSKYGIEYYRQLGLQGGAAARALGSTHYQAIGKKGGEAVRDRLGSAYYSAIGKQGGEKLAKERGSEFYRAIGKKGGRSPRRPKPVKPPTTGSPGAAEAPDGES